MRTVAVTFRGQPPQNPSAGIPLAQPLTVVTTVPADVPACTRTANILAFYSTSMEDAADLWDAYVTPPQDED